MMTVIKCLHKENTIYSINAKVQFFKTMLIFSLLTAKIQKDFHKRELPPCFFQRKRENVPNFKIF